MKKLSNYNDFHGIDVSNEISLFEYGLLVKQYTKDGRKDEYFCIYGVGSDEYGNYNTFDTGYITEEELNNLIQGKEWMNHNDIVSFLASYGTTSDEWMELSFISKLHDLIGYFGYENIMGLSYNTFEIENN